MQVRDRITEISDDFTNTERKLSALLLADYPFAGLEPIQDLSKKTAISTASISRFVNKIGFKGFLEFQRQLIEELRERSRSPIDLHKDRRPLGEAYFEEYTIRASALIEATAKSVTTSQLNHINNLICDERRKIFVIGGRISDPVAQYFSLHLRQIRPDVFHMPTDTELWPEYLLRMKPKDLLIMVDFRRYQPSLEALANWAVKDNKAHIVLFTDKWLSPIAANTTDIVAVPIENGTPWDSYIGAVAILEALLVKAAEKNWTTTRKRIEKWDSLRLDISTDENS